MKLATTFCISLILLATTLAMAEEPFRPEPGKFPPPDKSVAYDGQLVFVDHANRRGSIRVPGEELFYRSQPRPFAMLPYGMIRHHGAPADLRDIPLGTMLHGRFYLPPDPLVSSVPVVKRGTDTHPAENHAILLEDEPSYCLREGKVWRLQEVEIQGREGTVVANRGPLEEAEDQESEQQMTIDAATRIWRGRERLTMEDLITEGLWPASGKKSLDGQIVYLGISWKPAGTWARRVGNRFHVSDIWLDETAMQRASQQQTEVHKSLIRSRWMPAWVDAVEYGEFGHATVTATLFGGMAPSLYADFTKGTQGQIGASELTLKHSSGNYGQGHLAIRGPIVDVTKSDNDAPLGSSGIQISIKVDLVLEGFRPGNIVRIRPLSWPDDAVPREEFHPDGNFSHEERFPTSAIFPKY
jgi:hypothetical protein